MLNTRLTPALVAVRYPAALAAGAQMPESGTFSRCDGLLGTGDSASHPMDVRSASGWLTGRRPVIFRAGRLASLGTEIRTILTTMARAASGWLTARSSSFSTGHRSSLGTASADAGTSVRRRSSGWLSVRCPIFFTEGCRKFPGTEFSDALRTMAAAASGWLTGRSSAHFQENEANYDDVPHYHLPVFPEEVIAWSGAGPGSFVVDGTLGGGGHSELFLQAGARVLGVDRDPEALEHAQRRLASYGSRFSCWEGNFAEVVQSPPFQSGEKADVLLMDLGVSSRQLDSAARGFSFQKDGPLDMRMGPSSPRTAADIVNGWTEDDIVKILFEYGEESKARRIAAAIVKRRANKPFHTTLDLAGTIEQTVGRHGRTHPATKTFQAIRMAVNEELESLSAALEAVPLVLKPGGKLLIITFHSLEDRMVKRFLKHRSTEFLDEPGWPEPRPNPRYQFRLLSRKAVAPTSAEIARNPRARSAKLRVAQLLSPES